MNQWFLTIFRLILNFRKKAKTRRFTPRNLVLHWFQSFYNKLGPTFPGRKISPKSKGINPWLLINFQPFSNFRNKVKTRRFRRRNLVMHWFQSFYNNFRPRFEVEKCHQTLLDGVVPITGNIKFPLVKTRRFRLRNLLL